MNIEVALNWNFILATFILIGADVLTGVLKGFVTGTLSSKKMREGIKHKMVNIAVVIFGIVIETCLSLYNIPYDIPCATACCIYIGFMEVISCIENFDATYPNLLPQPVVKMLLQTAKTVGVPVKDGEDDAN